MANSFQRQYRAALEQLYGSTVQAEGVSPTELTRIEQRLGLRAPAALAEFYLNMGRFDLLLRAHDRFRPPEEWTLEDGRLVFLDENEGTAVWGIALDDLAQDDPPVQQGIRMADQPFDWQVEHPRCSDFLQTMLFWQAALGGFDWLGMAEVAPDIVQHFESHWEAVGQMSELRAFGRDGQVACLLEGDEGEMLLFVGARTEDDFRRVQTELESLEGHEDASD